MCIYPPGAGVKTHDPATGQPTPGKTPGSRRPFPSFRSPPGPGRLEASSHPPAREVPGDRGPRPDQALRPDNSGRSSHLRRPSRRRDRLPRAERLRQVHHDAPDPGPGRARPWHGQDRRPRLPRPAVPAPRGWRAARSFRVQGLPPRPHRPGAPASAGRQQRHPAQPGRPGTPPGRPADGGQPQGRPALPRHGSAAGHRRRLVLTLGTVEKHVAGIFAKLGLPACQTDNRRVLAVLRYLGS